MKDIVIAVVKHFLSNCNISPKNYQGLTGIEPMTFALLVRRCTNKAMKPSTLGAGHFVGFIRPWKESIEEICIYEMIHMLNWI